MAMQQQLSFEVVEGWEQLPAGLHHGDVCGVAVDSGDRVYLFTRKEARIVVYDRDGTFLRSWGDDFFTPRAHGITIGPNDELYLVDEGVHCVYQMSPDFELLRTFGNRGNASDTGYDGRTLESIHGGPPFNRPTNLAVAPGGDVYVSDGYGNARVHHFSPDGELIRSWGEPGTGPGQFNLVHGIAIAADGKVYVADRENDRVQIFDLEGNFLNQWTDLQRPTQVTFDRDGLIYVSELWRPVGHRSMRLGVTEVDLPGRISIFNPSGSLLARWGHPADGPWGAFFAPHDICADSHGDLYIGEVTDTLGVGPGLIDPACHTFGKFRRQS